MLQPEQRLVAAYLLHQVAARNPISSAQFRKTILHVRTHTCYTWTHPPAACNRQHIHLARARAAMPAAPRRRSIRTKHSITKHP